VNEQICVDDLNASFSGDVYGEAPSNDSAWFREHVARNDVDLARSRRWTVDGALSGIALLAFRGDRAWLGGFGVVPEFRGRGLARRYLAETLAIARDSGAASVELEVLAHNAAAIALYEGGGFTHIGDLVVWTRAPLAVDVESGEHVGEGGELHSYDVAAVTAIARTPATCWQREPRSVAAASPLERIVVGDGEGGARGAYAFMRYAHDRVSLDAGARDSASAAALLVRLDARVPDRKLMLINEPPYGPLHDALVAHPGWSEMTRQRRMRIALR
jgi:GNAT superfamily N-acetyltransferase